MNTAPDFWTAVFTCGLLLVGICALRVARGQLATVKTERTVNLITEASSPEMEDLLGFFDFAADVRVSKKAFTDLFMRLIKSRPQAIRERDIESVDEAAEESIKLLERELDGNAPSVRDEQRELELRGRIVKAMNFLERLWILIDRNAIDKDIFLDSQGYNIAAPYFVLEDILRYLHDCEAFDFDDARKLAVLSRAHLSWLATDHPLRSAKFAPF